MNIQNLTPVYSSQLASLRIPIWRDSVARQDRLASDQRIDAPEIQQSYRVSFSSAVLADPVGAARDAAQTPVDPRLQPQQSQVQAQTQSTASPLSPALRAYRQIAAL